MRMMRLTRGHWSHLNDLISPSGFTRLLRIANPLVLMGELLCKQNATRLKLIIKYPILKLVMLSYLVEHLAHKIKPFFLVLLSKMIDHFLAFQIWWGFILVLTLAVTRTSASTGGRKLLLSLSWRCHFQGHICLGCTWRRMDQCLLLQ